jgi:glycosyltransferase involved in cell wall biosynthesis
MSTHQEPRVAFLGYAHDARGGIAQFGRGLAEAVSEQAAVRLVGYRKLYPRFTRPGRQPPDPSIRAGGITGASLPVPWLPWTWAATARHIAEFRSDLLVVQWWTPLMGGCVRWLEVAARRHGMRTLLMIHNDRPHEAFPFWRAITRSTLGAADALAAFTPEVGRAVESMVPGARVHVSPLPQALVPPSANGTGSWDARLGAHRGPEILFFGNVREYKGLADLVEALPLVRRSVDATLVVAGSFFEPIERYRKQARRLGVEDQIRFISDYVPDEDVPALFARSDIVALPYRSAPGSGVLGQAAVAGRPVVASAVGALPELVGDRGVLVAPHDPAALADGLVRALREPPPPPLLDEGAWDHWRDFVLGHARGA